MKKISLLFLTALLSCMAIGAQVPVKMDLQPNQRLLGHYTTDSIALGGCWGLPLFANRVMPIATDLTADELAVYQGGKIVAFRVGLSQEAPVTRVFVIPIYSDGSMGEVTEWPCSVSEAGWNIVELSEPYILNLPSDAGLRIGFDYKQLSASSKPISAVKVGNIYSTLHFYNGKWVSYGVNLKGNLSLQCIVEKDVFPDFVIRMRNLYSGTNVKVGDPLPFSFETCKLGDVEVPAGECVWEVAIDGMVVSTVSNPETLTDEYVTVSGGAPTDGLSGGIHTLTVTVKTVNGEPVTDPISLSRTFKTFDFGFTRKMHLVEQFTSTGCTYCPNAIGMLKILCAMRSDVALVAIHENMNGPDPYRTAQCDTIAGYQNCTGYPEGSVDRTAGLSSANEVCAVLNYGSSTNQMQAGAQDVSSFMDYVDDLTPSWATVNINSTYDTDTRKAVVTITGDLVPNYEDFMGADSKLTVYITEDSLVAPQTSGGNDFVHNNVFRMVLGPTVKGVALNKTGDSYMNEFDVDIPEEWDADQLHIVAFVSRPLGNALTDIYVTNTNKRKLGEFDEPTTMKGDVNGDNKIDVTDVVMLIDAVLKGTQLDLAVADMNDDGKLDVTDVVQLIEKVLE